MADQASFATFFYLEGMKNRLGSYIEITIHILFWMFIFASVNVNWTVNWFDPSIRSNRPAPLSVVIFPILFYANALWAIPKFLNREKWWMYILVFLLIFVVPEFIRIGLLSIFKGPVSFGEAFSSRDSFLLGSPNIFWMGVTTSFAYRFTKDWFVKQSELARMDQEISALKSKKQESKVDPLPKKEAQQLIDNLKKVMEESSPFLNPKLSLHELAEKVDTTDKKLSTLLNQNMNTSFYDYLNAFRVEAFKQAVKNGELTSFSVIGLANQCGFTSKSSFYRAFKKEMGITPSEFIKSQ